LRRQDESVDHIAGTPLKPHFVDLRNPDRASRIGPCALVEVPLQFTCNIG
jgi:hypothetical protein